MLTFTEEQIAQLAPDASSLKAGRDLANEKKWPDLHYNHRVIWGLAQGSGSQPYRTQVDQGSLGYNCNCPSRKFPCKHALGLLFLFVRRPDLFKQSNGEPDWVEKWMNTREEKVEKAKAERLHPAIKDVKSKAKRENVRQELVKAGAAELELLLRDVLRAGLLNLPARGHGFFEQAAARMVDQQAGGLAQMLRQFTKINFGTGQAWHSEALEQVVQIWQVLQAFKNIDDLPELLRDDVRSLIGWAPKQEELLSDQQALRVKDHWLILGRHSQVENKITVVRFYLWGCQSGQSALLLDFIAPGTAPKYIFAAGMTLEATLVFFPSQRPFRALLEADSKTQMSLPESKQELSNWKAAQTALAKDLARYPWAESDVTLLQSLQLIPSEERWYLQDQAGALMPLHPDFSEQQRWLMLAITGGHACLTGVLRKRDAIIPLGVLVEGQYKSF